MSALTRVLGIMAVTMGASAASLAARQGPECPQEDRYRVEQMADSGPTPWGTGYSCGDRNHPFGWFEPQVTLPDSVPVKATPESTYFRAVTNDGAKESGMTLVALGNQFWGNGYARSPGGRWYLPQTISASVRIEGSWTDSTATFTVESRALKFFRKKHSCRANRDLSYRCTS